MKNMKAGQYFALVTGLFFLALGILGFVPALVQSPENYASAGYGNLFGLFPVNYLHNLVHIIVGLVGLLAAISLDSVRVYGRVLAISYALLAVMGLFPFSDTLFGLMPIFGGNVGLNAMTAAIAFYFGFVAQPGLLKMSTQSDVEVQDYFNLPPREA